MTKFLTVLDGTNKPPRPAQVDYLKHLADNWSKVSVFGVNAPPGIGKSFIARTIQRAFPGNVAIITPNNILVDQYKATYPELATLKGQDYYETEEDYRRAKKHAEYKPTVFNPLSFYYFFLNRPALPKPQIIVIDEAHKLAEMLLLIINQELSVKEYDIPEDLTDVTFYEWLTARVKKLEIIATSPAPMTKAREKLNKQFEKLSLLHDYLTDNLHTVKISYEVKAVKVRRGKFAMTSYINHLIVQPLEFPHDLMRKIFGTAKIVLLSGTITEPQIKELYPFEDKIDFKAYEPQAPIENRPIFFRPVPMGYRKNTQALAKAIREIYIYEKCPNTLVHVSYSQATELAFMLKDLPIVIHGKDTKQQAIDKFKRKGGILIGSGMAEGVDLPGDYCRLIIIPRLLLPNIGDQSVQKRLNLPGGQLWYDLTSILTTIQQTGRGVRSATDSCRTYILDPLFSKVLDKTRRYLTKGFIDSIDGITKGVKK